MNRSLNLHKLSRHNQRHNNPNQTNHSRSNSGPNRLGKSARKRSRGGFPSRSGKRRRGGPGNRRPPGNRNGDGCSKAAAGRSIVHGNRVVRNGGKAIIAPGRNVGGMAVTTFPRPPSVSLSGVNTGSGFAAGP